MRRLSSLSSTRRMVGVFPLRDIGSSSMRAPSAFPGDTSREGGGDRDRPPRWPTSTTGGAPTVRQNGSRINARVTDDRARGLYDYRTPATTRRNDAHDDQRQSA